MNLFNEGVMLEYLMIVLQFAIAVLTNIMPILDLSGGFVMTTIELTLVILHNSLSYETIISNVL